MDPLALRPVLEIVPYYLKDMATTGIISKPPENSSTSGLRQQLSSEEWEVLRPLIQHLYIEENWTYLHIADFLAKAHGFRPTRKQFTSRVGEWGFKKNSNKKERSEILQGRRLVNNDGVAGIKGAKFKKQKLERWHKEMRKDSSQDFTPISQSLIEADLDYEQFLQPSTSAEEFSWDPFVAMDVDLPTRSVGLEGDAFDAEDRHFPFRIWTTVDILGSPKLARLLENLKIETSGLPEDIESLVLPAPAVESCALSEESFVSSSELEILCRSDNGSFTSWNDGATSISEIEPHLAGISTSERATVITPFNFHNSDAWFPSGAQIERYPSPFDELYPFPLHYSSQTVRSSRPLVEGYQIQETEYGTMLEQLKRGGFDDTKPVVLEITRRLAQAYYDQGKQRQAEILYRKLISAQKRSDATELADMLSVQIDLVNTICEQGRFLEAKDLQANVHGAIINTFASHHHLVRRSLSAIIRIWGLLQNHEEEEAICRQLVQISLTHLGPRDPDTLDAIYRLALSMRGRKQFVESESLQRITVQLYQEAHKYRHSDICWSLEALARVFNDQGRTEEAINLFRLSAERAREFLGVEHVSTMNCYRVLGRELRKQGLFQESEELLVATVKIQINVMGEDYPYTLWSIYELGETLLKRDKYQESSIWLKKSFRQSLVIFGPLNDLAIESCDSLGVCYESQGLYGEAMALYQELLDKLRAAKGDNEQSIAKVEGWIQDIHSFGAEWAERYP